MTAAPPSGDIAVSVLKRIRWLAWGAVAVTLGLQLSALPADPTPSTALQPDLPSASCGCAHNPEATR